MKTKKYKGHANGRKLEQAVEDAYDRGDLSMEAYNQLARAGPVAIRGDPRDGIDASSPVVEDWIEAPPAPPAEECIEAPPSPPAEDCPEAPAPAAPAEDMSADERRAEDDPAPERATESALADVEAAEELPAERCVTDERTERARSEHEITEKRGAVDETGTGQEDPNGQGFIWCFGCGRVDVVKYGLKVLPSYFKGNGAEPEFGIVLVLCGTCRSTPAHSWQAKAALESGLSSSFKRLKLMPQAFEGSVAVQAARAVAQREVSVLTDDGGVAYRDVDRIVKELGIEDQIASVDVESFQGSGQGCPRLAYVRGGLIS